MTARRLALALGVAVLVVVGLGLADEALARVGGGQNFGRPGGGGGGGGGGGDDIPIELLILVFQLVIEYPAVGVPLLAVLVGVLLVRGWVLSDGRAPRVERTRRAAAPARITRSIPGLSALRGRDPGFSLPVLLDYVVLVHRRALEAVGTGAWDALQPFVADGARERLRAALPDVVEVSEVVVGGVRVLKIEPRNGEDHLVVKLESTRLERRKDGQEARVLVIELWTFRRASGATSPPPERLERLGCPNCGAAIEVTRMGECTSCGTPITRGQLQWQAAWVDVRASSPTIVPKSFPGGDEPSVHEPTVSDGGLDRAMTHLRARHPEFDVRPLGKRIELVYHELQKAWSAGRWADARPYVTDRMYQALRFWIDRYAASGLRNVLEDVRLEQVQIVKIDLDAHYTSITVRIWGSMKDTVVDATSLVPGSRPGKSVVGGSPGTARRFSEYWTFLRSADAPADTKGEAVQCPSCGAPLDRVDQAGVCGYCDTKITSGRFDWVLARIEQPEAYGG